MAMATAVPPRSKQLELAFIGSCSLGKPDPKARQLIRSHVMRGKNRRMPATDRPKLRSWINQESSQHHQSDWPAVPGPFFPLPMQIGSDMPLSQFAYDMPPYALDLVFKYFTVVLQTMFPIELCLKFDPKTSIWVEYLAVDELFCHAVLWTTQAYFDWLRGFEYSRVQLQHAHETLALLQHRLTDSRLATSNTTICVVVGLVMMTALMGDYESSIKHIMGLYKMVELRGGVKAFIDNSLIQLKICRADLIMALVTDNKPRFFSEHITWEPYIAKGQDTHSESLPKHFAGLDRTLCYIWVDLREFTRSANLAFQTGQKMDSALFQEILVSVQYRLLLLDVSTGSVYQAIHVGMLAFSTNIFLQMQGVAMRFEKLSTQLRDAIFGLQGLENDNMGEFKLWLLFVARMCIVTENKDPWLMREMRKTLEDLHLISWKTVRDRLKDYLWIDVLHDSSGKRTFEDANTGSTETLKGLGFNS